MSKKIMIVGIGNCGSQVAALAEKKYPELVDAIYINSSAADLDQVPADESRKLKVGKSGEIEGSGKNRTKMKQILKEEIEEVIGNNEMVCNMINEKIYCFIIASAAGGTGSGTAPVLMHIMREMFTSTNFILVGVLPQLGASLMEQGNTIEFVKELYEILGPSTTYMIYDNETTANLSPTRALEVVNEQIVEDIHALSGAENYPTPYESIDEADMESIITTPGRLMVIRLKNGLTEKTLEDIKVDDMIIKCAKKSAHAETDRNKKVVRWGVITYLTESVNRLYTGNLDGLLDFIGTPTERFNHNAINKGHDSDNFLYLIAAGLSPINDRTKKIADRITELKNQLATDEASKFILSGDGASYNDLITKREERKREHFDRVIKKGVNIEDAFGKFM